MRLPSTAVMTEPPSPPELSPALQLLVADGDPVFRLGLTTGVSIGPRAPDRGPDRSPHGGF